MSFGRLNHREHTLNHREHTLNHREHRLNHREHPLELDELALQAACGDGSAYERMHWRVKQDRDAFKEIWLLFENGEGRFPLYPGERTAVTYTYRVSEEKWGSWFQRAVGIARRRNDWRIYASSYHGLAEVALRRGAWRYAEERFRFGLRAARRNGFRSEQADGYIGLLRVAVATGRFEEARRWESRARRLVGRGPERLQKLAAASVDLWMHTGDYARALEGLEILRLDTTSREQRMYVLARIAHASAGIGDIHRLSDAWTQAWDLAESAVSAPRQLRYHTFIELHRAAALTRDQVRAVRALNFAAGLARVSSESHEVDELRRGAGRTQPASAPPGDAPDASGEVSSREAGDPAVEAIHE